ncbi:DNA-nicking endonuclease, Smr domain [Paracoccus isoporae]|uniref:DNA-nicking endonuclease, Smr domain n=1 Tax=Paracoccus isoporae TaxID=591205 RepID=A0A1G6UUG6_9RHOB|nr:Smr/MutS family protein [Paracoccus isoporae]SDD44939.1 DNA-nicking endonuclease, Smr domain [Paracoccus isoporae]
MSKRRGLTPEDRELWSRVVRNTTPMHDKAKLPDPADPPRDHQPARPMPAPQPAATLPRGLRIGAASVGAKPHLHAPGPADALRAQPVRMDQKLHRQMSRGKLRPQARLDLHGMTLAEAGPELTAFIFSCHSGGLRLVLIITGKGSRAGDIGPLPTRPGALRHQVPHWLSSPPLSRVVQHVAPAHHRHGGTGAYYVYLRR